MTTASRAPRSRAASVVASALRPALLTVLAAVLAAGCWWVWLAWDDTYQVDQATGVTSGPYEAWQVVGCVLSLMVLAVSAYLVLDPVLVGVGLTVGFTTAWCLTSLPQDDSRLAVVGAVMVLFAMSAATSMTGAVAAVVRARRTAAPARGVPR